jgi:hypothetical protein
MSFMRSFFPRSAAKPHQNDEPKDAVPVCDWVYFATPSKEDLATSRAFADQFGMIVRTIYDSRGNAIANVKNLRQGHTILMVFGGGRSKRPYQAMFSCTVVAPPHPVSRFGAFTYADGSQSERLQNSGYSPDPHFERFTGISIKVLQDLGGGRCSVPRPAGNNTIRRWDEVFATAGWILDGE